MIFLSHNYKDKAIVEPIAIGLKNTFGQENVFYDNWSIQPGDGIIDKMNEGLAKCKVFFYFISKNSLSSKMVTMEWQSVIMRQGCGEAVKFIPVKLDDSQIPAILRQRLYIRYNDNVDIMIRQMIDVVNGENIFKDGEGYHNLKAVYKRQSISEADFSIIALNYMEPDSRYAVIFGNEEDKDRIKIVPISDQVYMYKEIQIKVNDNTYWAKCVSVSRATTVGFPFKFTVQEKNNMNLPIMGIMHEIGENRFVYIPIEEDSNM